MFENSMAQAFIFVLKKFDEAGINKGDWYLCWFLARAFPPTHLF
jgi:hypothetical protein